MKDKLIIKQEDNVTIISSLENLYKSILKTNEIMRKLEGAKNNGWFFLLIAMMWCFSIAIIPKARTIFILGTIFFSCLDVYYWRIYLKYKDTDFEKMAITNLKNKI